MSENPDPTLVTNVVPPLGGEGEKCETISSFNATKVEPDSARCATSGFMIGDVISQTASILSPRRSTT